MYIAYSQPKGADVWTALRKGFDAAEADPSWTPGRQRKLYRNGTAILGGLDFDQPKLLREARDVKHRYVFVDAGYMAAKEKGKRIRYRVVPDAYNHFWMDGWYQRKTERFEALGIAVQPSRPAGRDILVCTSSDAHAAFFGLQGWVDETIATLKQHTDRRIIVRNKAQAMTGREPPFAEALKTAHAVVAWSSATAIEAALAGVIVVTGPESAAAPLSMGGFRSIEEPRRCSDQFDMDYRRQWAAHLAWCQFTVEEIASGLARECCETFWGHAPHIFEPG